MAFSALPTVAIIKILKSDIIYFISREFLGKWFAGQNEAQAYFVFYSFTPISFLN